MNNDVLVSGEQWRDSAIHMDVSILPQTLFHPDCHLAEKHL